MSKGNAHPKRETKKAKKPKLTQISRLHRTNTGAYGASILFCQQAFRNWPAAALFLVLQMPFQFFGRCGVKRHFVSIVPAFVHDCIVTDCSLDFYRRPVNTSSYIIKPKYMLFDFLYNRTGMVVFF